MYQAPLFYLNVPYKGVVYDFYIKGFQPGFGKLKGVLLYDSNEFVNDNGVKGWHTLSEPTLECLVQGIIKVR